jgi:release factor glutamine methyltransferase
MMTVRDWLAASTALLTEAGIGTARLDCLILLENVTGTDRAKLLAYPEMPLPDQTYARLQSQLELRATHLPLAYITGTAEFYGRPFLVDSHVLVPRPESESMISLLIGLHPSGTLLDVGTGSGALAITAALELPGLSVHGLDIDPACLKVARHNARTLQADVRLYEADLLTECATTPYDILLANLPYVPLAYSVNEAVRHEPARAIFGGDDGLDLYRTMFDQLATFHWQPKFILTESLPNQHGALEKIARQAGFTCTADDDFIQVYV